MTRRGTVLITGAAGFIGSNVAHALIAAGRSVVGVDNFHDYYDPARKERQARAAGFGPNARLERADICDAPAMRRLALETKPETIIHLAARAGVRPSIADPAGYAHTNVTGTASILEAARAASCARVVLASSSSVYGDSTPTPFSENADVSQPISPYAATKRANELQAWTHWHLTRTPIACLRFFTVYGPGQRPDLAIQTFMTKAIKGSAISVFGDGSTSRDYTFIDDIVAGVLAAEDRIDAHGCRVWNLGSDQPVTLNQMLAAIETVSGRRFEITRLPAQPGDVTRTWADVSRARAELGFEPRTSFTTGLARQWDAVRAEAAS